MTSPIIPQPKKLISKFSLSLLIVVISFVSMDGSAAHPHPPHEKDLAAICRDQVSHASAYHAGARKCFVVGAKQMNWHEAKRACSQLPRLPHFGPPALATININRDQMKDLLGNTMKVASYRFYWTGGWIPPQYGNNINEFRWVADGSRLSVSDPIWYRGYPRYKKWATCAAFDFQGAFALWNSGCHYTSVMLCHYEVGRCHLPPVPKNAHLSSKYQMLLPEGKVVVVRCNHGYEVKAGPHRKIQAMVCVNGSWTLAQDCI